MLLKDDRDNILVWNVARKIAERKMWFPIVEEKEDK